MHHLPTNIQDLFDAESYLGCKQTYYRWLAPHWISRLYPATPKNAKNYLATSLRLTWQTVLQIWTLWHTHLHPSNHKQEDHSQVQATVIQIFCHTQQHPIFQDVVNLLTPDQIMTWPTQHRALYGSGLPTATTTCKCTKKHLSYKLNCAHMIFDASLNSSLAPTAPIPQIDIYGATPS